MLPLAVACSCCGSCWPRHRRTHGKGGGGEEVERRRIWRRLRRLLSDFFRILVILFSLLPPFRRPSFHTTIQYAAVLATLLQNRPLFQAIYFGCLWARDKRWLLFRVQRLAGPAGDRGLLSRVEPPTGTKGLPFVPVGVSTRDKRPNSFVLVGNTNPD